jgi:hypothetical protein
MFRSEAAILADLKHFAIFPLPARQPPPAPRLALVARRSQRTGGHRRSPARLPVSARGIASAMLRRAAGRRSTAT